MKPRRRARALALQALFEIDSASHVPSLVLRERLTHGGLNEAGNAFVQSLVRGVLDHWAELNGMIEDIASDWPLAQMAIVDRNILRLAIYEMAFERQAPVKVVINEAVELAKVFGSDSSRRFVNGVLGTVAASPQVTPTHSVGDA
jgi:N utilization substance protein B